MRLPPYTVPAVDFDLLDCGVVLTPERVADTRAYNIKRGPAFDEYMRRVRERRSIISGIHGGRGRVNWYMYLMGLSYMKPEPVWAARMLQRALERWGEQTFASIAAEAERRMRAKQT